MPTSATPSDGCRVMKPLDTPRDRCARLRNHRSDEFRQFPDGVFDLTWFRLTVADIGGSGTLLPCLARVG